jgi:large subunit ribosomal protein L10
MAISREKKQAQLEVIKSLADKAEAITIAENLGVSSNQMNELRKNAKETGVVLMVAKNTITRRALKDHSQFSVICEDLNNPVMLGFSLNDLSASAKLLGKYALKNKNLTVKSVAIEGVRYDQSQLKSVMNLPSREQAIAMVARGMQAPVVQLACVLQEIYGQFARVLQVVAEQKSD